MQEKKEYKRKPSTGSAVSNEKKWTLAPHIGFLDHIECEREYVFYIIIFINGCNMELNPTEFTYIFKLYV